MRYSMATAVAAGLFAVCAGSAAAQGVPTGGRGKGGEATSVLSADQAVRWPCTITGIDATKNSFSCQGKTAERTFETNAHTRFLEASKAAAFDNLKTGEKVAVVSHFEGKQAVADEIMITP